MQTYQSDGGMGTPVLSIDGFFGLEPELPERLKAQLRAQDQLREAVAEERDYWARLSSTVLAEDEGDVSHVQQEFRDYAVHWARYGRGTDVITDFDSHRKIRDERLQRRLDKKEVRERATQIKLAAMASSPDDRQSQQAERQRLDAERRVKANAEMFLEQPAPELPFDPNVGLAVLEIVESQLRGISDNVVTAVPELDSGDRQIFIQGFDHMIATFRASVSMKMKYGYNAQDHAERPLAAGGDVPSYFANVSDGSIFRRKYLSMAGLRNLIIYGGTIYTQLLQLKFSGNLDEHGDNVGLKLMRRVTGNVVDLDTTVLRCTDQATLNAINASNKHKKLPVYANSNDFAASSQAQEIAVNCALPLLEDFAKALSISKAEMKTRRINPADITRPVPVAASNTDRGKHPVWQYVNVGQNSFHVNVPTMADVNGALLKAPFHCLRSWLALHTLHTGDELKTRVDDFFEHCVVDACFNGKWKSIEEYVAKMAHEGTIVDVLQRAQMKNQGVFTAEFFDADNENQDNEVREMLRLVSGLVAREAKTGVMRAVTDADVRAWVTDPSVSI
jgi:hypothetical protein